MLLEYSQRLATRQRNVLARDSERDVATAMTLDAVLGGAQASGRAIAGLALGQQADFMVLDAQHPLLRPGMQARVGVQVSGQGEMLIPITAVLIKDESHSVVFVQKGDTAFEARAVALGRPVRGLVPVVSGLQPGDRIVVRGGLLLDGAASQLL